MTRDEIILMADASGISLYGMGKDRAKFIHYLEAFAKLIAEAEPVAWPCLIDSADFSENTITLVMQCEDYKVSAGTHWLSTNPPKENT